MLKPAEGDLRVKRNAPFPNNAACTITIDGVVADLTGAIILMQVRLYGGAGGDPLIDLTSEDDSGDRIAIDTEANTWRPVISQDTHEALPLAQRRDEDAIFEYDVRVALADATVICTPTRRYVVETGVTR